MRKLAVLGLVIVALSLAWLALRATTSTPRALVPEQLEGGAAIGGAEELHLRAEATSARVPASSGAGTVKKVSSHGNDPSLRRLSLVVEARTPDRLVESPGLCVMDSLGRFPERIWGRNGSARLWDLHDGGWTVDVSARGFATARVQVEIDARRAPQHVSVELQPLTFVAVRIDTPDGRALADVDHNFRRSLWIACSDEPLPEYVSSGTEWWQRSSFGLADWIAPAPAETPVFADGGVAEGALVTKNERCSHVGVFHEGELVQRARLTPGQSELVLVVAPDCAARSRASIAWRVTSADPRWPVQNHHATLVDPNSASQRSAMLSGTIGELSDLPPTSVTLRLEAIEFAPLDVALHLRAGERRDLGVIELTPGAQLVQLGGAIVGVTPDEASTTMFELIRLDRDDLPSTARRAARVDVIPGLEFLVEELERARYVVRGSPNERGQIVVPHVIDLTLGSRTDVELRLVPAKTAWLRWPIDLPGGAWIAVETLDGLPVCEQPLANEPPIGIELAAGSYRVRRFVGELEVASSTFEMPDRPATLDVP